MATFPACGETLYNLYTTQPLDQNDMTEFFAVLLKAAISVKYRVATNGTIQNCNCVPF